MIDRGQPVLDQYDSTASVSIDMTAIIEDEINNGMSFWVLIHKEDRIDCHRRY